MNRLDILNNSLLKKQDLLKKVTTEEYNFVVSKKGEPLGNNRAYNRTSERFDTKIRNLEASIKKTKVAIEKEELKKKGLNYHGQIINSVSNIDLIRQKAESYTARGNKYYHLKKAKGLEEIKERAEKEKNILSDKTKALLQDGKIAQWEKKPIFYFVKGFKKAGLILTNTGDLYFCGAYPLTEDDKIKVEKYLDISFEENLKKHKENKIKE